MKKIILVLFAFTFCKVSPSLSIDQKTLITKVLEENQILHEKLIGSSSELPEISGLLNSLKKAKESISISPVDSLLNESISILEQIKLTDQESYFASISIISEKIAEIIKVAEIKEYNKFHCPMVNKYWVSKGEKIENPYSSEMRECGEMVK